MIKLLKPILLIPIFLQLTTGQLLAYQGQEINAPQKTILKGTISEEYSTPSTGIGVVGLRFIHQVGYPTYIKEVYPNSPAMRTGLRVNDLIESVDGMKTGSLSPDDVYQLLSGTPGSPVRITIRRGASSFNVDLIREDLANFSNNVQNRYLSGPISVPFDIRDLFPFD